MHPYNTTGKMVIHWKQNKEVDLQCAEEQNKGNRTLIVN